MIYAKDNLYEKFQFRNQKGVGPKYEVTQITEEYCSLEGLEGQYSKRSYRIQELINLLNSGVYVEISKSYKIFN